MITAVDTAPVTPIDTAATSGGKEVSTDACTDTPKISGKNIGKNSGENSGKKIGNDSGNISGNDTVHSLPLTSPRVPFPPKEGGRGLGRQHSGNISGNISGKTAPPRSPLSGGIDTRISRKNQHSRQSSHPANNSGNVTGKIFGNIPATIPATPCATSPTLHHTSDYSQPAKITTPAKTATRIPATFQPHSDTSPTCPHPMCLAPSHIRLAPRTSQERIFVEFQPQECGKSVCGP